MLAKLNKLTLAARSISIGVRISSIAPDKHTAFALINVGISLARYLGASTDDLHAFVDEAVAVVEKSAAMLSHALPEPALCTLDEALAAARRNVTKGGQA